MVRHIVIWDYNEKYNEKENKDNAIKIKEKLESLINCINGIVELKVIINPLNSSNGDLILNGLFQNKEAFEIYQNHPEHLRVAEFVAASTQNRRAFVYIE